MFHEPCVVHVSHNTHLQLLEAVVGLIVFTDLGSCIQVSHLQLLRLVWLQMQVTSCSMGLVRMWWSSLSPAASAALKGRECLTSSKK